MERGALNKEKNDGARDRALDPGEVSFAPRRIDPPREAIKVNAVTIY